MSTRLHITDSMVDAAYEAAEREAVKDGLETGFDGAEPQQIARFREVIRAMLQAGADAVSKKGADT